MPIVGALSPSPQLSGRGQTPPRRPLGSCSDRGGSCATSFSASLGVVTVTGSRAVPGLDQLAPLKCPPPLEYLVGVHAMRPGHFGDTGATFQSQLHNLPLLGHRSPP